MEKVQERVYDFCSVTFTLLVLSVSVVHDLVQLGLLLHKALSLSLSAETNDGESF